MNHRERRERVAAMLPEAGLDALLVSALPNIRYLTGFTGSNGLLVVSGSSATLYTDPRYDIQASQQVDCKVRIAKSALTKPVAAHVRRARWKHVGFEAALTPYATFLVFAEAMGSGVKLQPTGGMVEQLRMVKSAEEITLIERAVEVSDAAYLAALELVRPGVSELDLAAEIDHRMRLAGASGPSFETIVASGARTALPHAAPTPKLLRSNELLLIDMGAQRSGYASDMTRMSFLGKPGRKVRALYDAVLEAQLASLDAVRAGATCDEVDRAGRNRLRAHHMDKLFTHSTGHGLGLEIHEGPRIGKGERTPLEAGMVITIEPGVYMEGFGGVRIEDTVVVTETGCRILTSVPKQLHVH